MKSDYLNLFLETSSIRGCSKILKAQNKYIKWIWIVYLIVTSMGLIITIRFIVEEYLKYAVNLQTYIEMDSPEPFPDVSFCNHQPFSNVAFDKWARKEVLSPVEYNKIVRNTVKGKGIGEMFHYGIVRDHITDYYQNLGLNDVNELSHVQENLIYLCLLKWTQSMAISGAGCNDSSVHISHFSHPEFFNCYTFRVTKTKTDLEELNLILSMGPIDAQLESQKNAFIFNIFDQAAGLRIVVHEPGSQPDITRKGINIEPNRINELIYKTEKVKHISTPINPCTNSMDEFQDLENHYLYDFDLCVGFHMQSRVVKECQCYYRKYNRFNMPNETHPYCGKFIYPNNTFLSNEDYQERNRCVRQIQQLVGETRKSLYESNICPKRCSRTNYKIKSSATKWRFSDWQISWVKKIADDEGMDAVPILKQYVDHEDTPELNITQHFSNFTFLVIKRESNDTEVRNEQLVLTISALFSRIGGLCSLYIGFSFAVAVEMIEFFYNSFIHRRNNSMRKSENVHETILTNTNQTAIDQGSPLIYRNTRNSLNHTRRPDEIWHPQVKVNPNIINISRDIIANPSEIET